ncbi:(2,3-dihydroxybenzoyl)adenylate synthase [Pseudonocardia sp. HH130630-07]|uniref:(2,3-dihydroxybenzoyl)adenylate synthase n=1 Tax=Pseudonocardia sp. HH130630-07 TaxID=1690815 RepID=UPI000814E6D3|nr:AMP-binding protein [Pseudonocardia sp. HH130630-07]ANY10557.1 2,3-dihydroxybenzoate-AMP ligase [Pseudonocardia sp. HH130630-07]
MSTGPAPAEVDLLDGAVGWPAELRERYVAEGYWREETLGGLLTAAVRRHGDATAIVAGDERISYTNLDHRADERARALRALGIAPRDRVVVHLPNTAGFVVTLFALLRLGAVPVLTLPAHRHAEIAHLTALSEAVAYVGPDVVEGFDYRRLGLDVAAEVGSLRHVLVDGDPIPGTVALATLPAGSEDPLPRADPGQVAVLLVSGGTTGNPKLIPRTHRDYAYNARASAEVCGLTADDVYLSCLPLAHNFPLACPGLLGTLGVGGQVVLAPVPSPDITLPLVGAERVTVTAMVPPLLRLWVDVVGEHPGGTDLSSLRLVQVGGAKCDETLARRVRPELGAAVQQVFGMAEGLLNYTRLDDPNDLVAVSQGRPLSPADEVRVVNEHGVDVPDGEPGELWTRGPYTLRGYYRAREIDPVAFTPDGFYRSGDVVRRLPGGYLVVEGRIKDVVNRGGENVAATVLEDHVLAHPDVAAAAVLGVPDPNLGEAVCVVLRPVPGVRPPSRRALRSFLSGRGLARFMYPDRVVVREDLPLTAVGKIDKRVLAAELRDGAR